MKSVHVIGSRQFGGAEHFYLRLVQALHRAGHELLAVNRPGTPVARILADAALPQAHLPLSNKWDLRSVLRLRRLVAQEQPAVVQTYLGRATRLLRLPRHTSTRHIARLGGYYKIRGYYEHCDAWVGNTVGLCEHLVEQGLPAERVFHIGNFVPQPRQVSAVERAATREVLGLPDAAHIVLAVGRLIELKGFADLLEAFAQLPAKLAGRRPHLVIVGDGPLRSELVAQARRLGINSRVHWTGWQDDLAPWFGLADLLVCPSHHETLGNVILEGWSHGVPVLSTATKGAAELLQDGRNGLLVPIRATARLAERLTEALSTDSQVRGRLIAAGRASLARDHGAEAVVGAYLELYQRLVVMPKRQVAA